MCGIIGAATSPEWTPDAEAMMERIAHRGPDDRGLRTSPDGRVILGHRRLSIIDLSPAGHQPMSDDSGRLWLTFNGEIYNFQELRVDLQALGHTFRTHSDSEVILAAYRQWGGRCVERFNGMFAFAIHDEAAQTLFLARDRVGKKPLYWWHRGSTFLFGSEAKAVVAATGSRELDPESVNHYFAFGCMPRDRSIFSGLRRLLPGHTLSYDLVRNAVTISCYWTPWAQSRGPVETDPDALLAEMESLVADSVRLRMIADVPLGVLLSGGLDSSIITAMAARQSARPVKTFTVTFPGGGRYDESEHAKLVARHFGTEHHELPLPEANIDVLRELAHHLDEPLADPSIVPTYLVSRLTRRHVTVALGGDGGDELFGGYGWYRSGVDAARNIRRVPQALRRAAAGLAGVLPPGIRGRNFVRAHAGDLAHYIITNATTFEPALRRKLLRRADDVTAPERERRALWNDRADDVLAMSLFDLATYLPDDILTKVDRASMAVALEMRAPLLDYRLVEFAVGRVPSHEKVTTGGVRFLQKRLAKKLLPPQLDLQRKQGFVMPVHDWLRGAWGTATVEAVRSAGVREWVDPAVAENLLHGQRRGRTNGVRLFTLLMFALWIEGLR